MQYRDSMKWVENVYCFFVEISVFNCSDQKKVVFEMSACRLLSYTQNKRMVDYYQTSVHFGRNSEHFSLFYDSQSTVSCH